MKSKKASKTRRVWNFVKENKVLIAQLCLMGAVVLSSDTSFANTQAEAGFEVVTNPLTKFQNTITGPVATAIGTAGAALLGLSVAMNFENQIAKRGVQGVGGIGLGLGASSLISGGSLGTAFLF